VTAGEATFYWDFFGPRAEGTARHFQRHLEEFLAREGVVGCTTDVHGSSPNQWTVSCRTPANAAEPVRRARRPRRERGGP
jgi:hypothetical protein